jgi:hypothetical protein
MAQTCFQALNKLTAKPFDNTPVFCRQKDAPDKINIKEAKNNLVKVRRKVF